MKGRRGETRSARRRFSPSHLRIVGGTHRGRKIVYSGDPQVRPMKDRTREAVFNLIGPLDSTFHAIDLFAGTGALALEALSRGVARATLIERHRPTARTIRTNVEALDLADRARIVEADAFRHVRVESFPEAEHYLVFCCPPYRFYAERPDAMRELIATIRARLSPGSVLVVEADEAFDVGTLPETQRWRHRHYKPAQVAVWIEPADSPPSGPISNQASDAEGTQPKR